MMQTTNPTPHRRHGHILLIVAGLLMAVFLARVALESAGITLFTLSPAEEALLLVAAVACFITACIRLE
ncbi:hypothetical protein KGQ90_03530 [Modicisalibacter tunisiensis]|uniref:hypothetical protein n=1 Tax=Modicisalibacter tunisiensis TaxID=390637 RepID=UPI001CCB2416|nr:hypothetical protein [Modicisalibacter tunisiensis]MBZ9538014.1 hypothetical protein [Modicisalibacter tunisiensis]